MDYPYLECVPEYNPTSGFYRLTIVIHWTPTTTDEVVATAMNPIEAQTRAWVKMTEQFGSPGPDVQTIWNTGFED